LARTKKLRNAKIKVWQMPSDSGEQVWPDSCRTLSDQWPDSVISGWIPTILAKSDWLQTMARIQQYFG
jgi:hypothetical protein